MFKGSPIRLTADISSNTLQAWREWRNKLGPKGGGEEPVETEYYT